MTLGVSLGFSSLKDVICIPVTWDHGKKVGSDLAGLGKDSAFLLELSLMLGLLVEGPHWENKGFKVRKEMEKGCGSEVIFRGRLPLIISPGVKTETLRSLSGSDSPGR